MRFFSRYATGTRLLLPRWTRRTFSVGAVVLVALAATADAWAGCRVFVGSMPPQPSPVSPLPSRITLNKAPIGGVLATLTVGISSSSGDPAWRCTTNETWGMAPLTTTLVPLDEGQGLYGSGIPGIGIRLRFDSPYAMWGAAKAAPFEKQSGPGTNDVSFASRLRVDLIRTATEVGKGKIGPFDLQTSYYITGVSGAPGNRLTIPIQGLQMSTSVEQDFYYTSCYNPSVDPIVKLGNVPTADIRRGPGAHHDFALDIRCEGMNPSTKPPLSIYFSGNALRDGLLHPDGLGQPGVAKGVVVDLTSGSGAALPFTQAKALPLAWQRTEPNAEFYRFEGKARYAPTGEPVEAGKADATLTYILQYN